MPFDSAFSSGVSMGIRMFAPIASGVYGSRMLVSGSTSENLMTYDLRLSLT